MNKVVGTTGRRLAWLVALVCWVGVAEGAAPTVTELVVRNGAGAPVDVGFVLARVSSTTNRPFDRAAVSKDVKALLDTGVFSNVGVELEPIGEDGARLVFVVERKRRLGERIRVVGAEELSQNKVRDLLGIEAGALVDEQSLKAAGRNVIKEYRDRNYPDARIDFQIQDTDLTNGIATVTASIVEGAEAVVESYAYEGAKAFTAKDLDKITMEKRWWDPFDWFCDDTYDPEEVEDKRAAIVTMYRNDGYLDARVAQPTTEVSKRGRLIVHCVISEGPRYSVNTLTFSGVTIYPEAELRRAANLERGATASAEAIRMSAEQVEDYYGSRGYWRTQVRPSLRTDVSNATADIVFQVGEGRLTRVGNVRIRGNVRTRDKVIRRELVINPGELYNSVGVKRSESILRNLGYFERVSSYGLDTPIPDVQDLVFEVEEKSTGQISGGVGFSSIENVFGYLEVAERNFDLANWPSMKGGGQKGRVRGQWGTETRRFDVEFTEPWFLDRKLSLGVNLYNSSTHYTDYDVDRKGVAVSLSKALTETERILFKYRLEKRSIVDESDTVDYVYVDSPGEKYSFLREDDGVKSSLETQLSHDTRNSPFFATEGNRLQLSGELAGGPLGFDFDLYDVTFKGSHYFPLWLNHVANLRSHAEVVDSFGDTAEVPIEDRLFAGGARTIRGFRYRDVGPKVRPATPDPAREKHRPVGGRSLLLGTAEYQIPIKEGTPGLRLAIFLDAGNVWRDPFVFDVSELALGAGLGLRFDLPGFPIRLDYGWALEKDNEVTDTDTWTFSLGFDN